MPCLSICLGPACACNQLQSLKVARSCRKFRVHFFLWYPYQYSSTMQCMADQYMPTASQKYLITCSFTYLLQQNILSPVFSSAKHSFMSLAQTFTPVSTSMKCSFTCLSLQSTIQLTFQRTHKSPLHVIDVQMWCLYLSCMHIFISSNQPIRLKTSIKERNHSSQHKSRQILITHGSQRKCTIATFINQCNG